MLKTLIAKEWHQLRLTRLFGIVIGLLLPPGLVLFASLNRVGWLPISSARSWSHEQLFSEPLQALYVALWMLITLLVGAQLYSSDRGSGTEWFLLERPVKRSTIWSARLVTAFANWLLTVVTHLAAYTAWNFMWTTNRWQDIADNFLGMTLIGAVLFVIATGSAAIAAGFLKQPTQVALVALVLSLLPVGLVAVFINISPMMRGLGLSLPWALPIGYFIASFRMETVPEPAGRGRWRYGLWIVLPLLLLIPVVHFAATPVVQRTMASGRHFQIFANEQGTHAVAMTRAHGGWLIDLQEGETIKFLPPPLESALWHPDGTRVALGHMALPWGGVSAEPMIEIVDVTGATSTPQICRDCDIWRDGGRVWSGEQLLVHGSSRERPQELIVINTDGSEQGRISIDEERSDWWIQRGYNTLNPAIVHARWEPEDRSIGKRAHRSVSVSSIDTGTLIATSLGTSFDLHVGEELLWERENIAPRVALSPGRNYWITGGSVRNLISSASGQIAFTFDTGADNSSLALLDSDRKIAYVQLQENGEDAALIYGPLEAPVPVANWRKHHVYLRSNSSNSLALVAVSERRESNDAIGEWEPNREVWLLNGVTGEFSRLGTKPGEETSWFGGFPRWASDTQIQVGGEGERKLYDVVTGEIIDLEPILPG